MESLFCPWKEAQQVIRFLRQHWVTGDWRGKNNILLKLVFTREAKEENKNFLSTCLMIFVQRGNEETCAWFMFVSSILSRKVTVCRTYEPGYECPQVFASQRSGQPTNAKKIMVSSCLRAGFIFYHEEWLHICVNLFIWHLLLYLLVKIH